LDPVDIVADYAAGRVSGIGLAATGLAHTTLPYAPGAPKPALTYAAASPVCRSNASIDGRRPRKATNSSIASREPPCSRIWRRKLSPVARLKIPSSSKREKASADSTSAHL